MKHFKGFLHILTKSIGMRFKLLLFNARPLIIFELLFNAISTSLFTPLLFIVFRFAMGLTNNPLLTADNIFQFLLNPITIIFVVVILFLIALISLIDISAALFIFECSREKKKTTIKDTIIFSFKNSIRLFKPRNLLIVFVVLVILPLVSIGTTSSFLGRYQIPSNFYEFSMANPITIIVVLIFFTVMVFLAMKWVFAIHYFTLEKLDFITSIKKSWHLLRGNTIRNFISIMIVQIVIVLLTKGLNMCGSFFIHQISSTLGERTLIGSFAISIASVLFLAIYLILFAVFLPYSCLKISALFYERKREAKEKIIDFGYKGVNLSKKKIRKIKITIGIMAGVLIILGTCILYFSQSYMTNNSSGIIKNREIIADRGSSLESAENTKSAIETSAKLGADTICVDVQISTDNIPYLHRTSKNQTYDEISRTELKAFTTNGISYDKIPTLEEAIESVKTNNIAIMLDISTINYNEKKLDIILSKIGDYKDKVSIASDKYDDLIEVKKMQADIKTVYNLGSAIGDFSGFDAADTLALDLWCIDSQSADDIHKMGRRLIALNAKSKDKIEDAMETKIDGLKTIQVAKAVELNKTHGLPEFMYVFVDNIN